MTAPLNGQAVTRPEEDPATFAARTTYEQSLDPEQDVPWADLEAADRDDLVEYAKAIIAAHALWLTQHGIRLIGPGMVLRPKDEREAYMMLQASKEWFDAAKRAGKPVGRAPRKLIVPGRAH